MQRSDRSFAARPVVCAGPAGDGELLDPAVREAGLRGPLEFQGVAKPGDHQGADPVDPDGVRALHHEAAQILVLPWSNTPAAADVRTHPVHHTDEGTGGAVLTDGAVQQKGGAVHGLNGGENRQRYEVAGHHAERQGMHRLLNDGQAQRC